MVSHYCYLFDEFLIDMLVRMVYALRRIHCCCWWAPWCACWCWRAKEWSCKWLKLLKRQRSVFNHWTFVLNVEDLKNKIMFWSLIWHLCTEHHITSTLFLEFLNVSVTITTVTGNYSLIQISYGMESYQTFLAQIAGYFIVEDQLIRTAGDFLLVDFFLLHWSKHMIQVMSYAIDRLCGPKDSFVLKVALSKCDINKPWNFQPLITKKWRPHL